MLRTLRTGILVAGALLCLLLSTNALAVSAMPVLKTFQQPDGTTFTGVQQGDEWFHWYRTNDGKVFVQNPVTKAYEYAQLIVSNGERKLESSGVRVGAFTLRSFDVPEQNLWQLANNWRVKLGGSYPAFQPKAGLKLGGGLFGPQAMTMSLSTAKQFKTLVVFVQFTDYTLTNTLQPWSDKIFSTLPDSLNDYYDQASGGKAIFVPAAESHGTANDGFVIATLAQAHPHPGRNFSVVQTLAVQALAQVDPQVNFAGFDADLDGEISSDELQLLFIFAGPESSSDGEANGVWGHKSNLPSEAVLDNVKLGQGRGNYAAIGELQNGHDATIGIIAHELGHSAFYLPDMYPQVGMWDLMGTGSWGQRPDQPWGGQSPALMSAWTKVRAGFLDPTYIDPMYAAATHTLHRTLSSSHNALVFPAQDSNIKFVLEHRRLEGYDRGILPWVGSEHEGKSGVMASIGTGGTTVVRADNAESGSTYITNLYYPGNQDRWGTDTTPATVNPYSSLPSNFVFENIAYNGDEMTVSVRRAGGTASCQIHTATATAHVTAGRAYKVTTGTFFPTTTYYAVGSDENLGTLGYVQVSLKESPAGYFAKGTSCPAAAAPVVQSFTDYHANKRFEGLATDAENDIARIEVEFDNDGLWHRADTRTTENANERLYLFSYAGLAVGQHSVRVRAIDAGNRNHVYASQTVTIDPQQAPTCEITGVYRDAADYWMVTGQADDVDIDVARVEVRLDGGAWTPAILDYLNRFQSRLSEQPHGSAGALPDGTYTVEARVWDKGGLNSSCGPFSFEVGTERAPAVLSVNPTVYADNIDLYGQAADMDADLTGVELEIDGSGQWVLADSFYLDSDPRMGNYNHRFAGLAAGNHSVRVRAVDAGGLRSPDGDPISVHIAAPQAPTCTVSEVTTTPEGYTTANGTAFDANNDIVSLEVLWLENGQWVGSWGTTEWAQYVAENPLPPGTYEVQARARDSRDTYGYCSKTYVVPGASSCFTAANSAHAAAARATVKYVNLYYANGSDDYLGLAADVTSLELQGANWEKVTSCP